MKINAERGILMYAKTTEIKNKTGLHARPASDFVSKAKQFKSDIFIQKLGDPAHPNKVNAKSIVLVLTLALSQGQLAEVSASGEDEVEAVDALIHLIDTTQE